MVMKKVLAALLAAVSLAATAYGADIPYLDKVAPAYRGAASDFILDYTSDADLARSPYGTVVMDEGRETVTVPADGADPAVNLYVYRPQGAGKEALPVIYYTHGGGFLFRSALGNTARYQNLADMTGAAVVTPRYRLSVEAPFPAALIDAARGLAYVKDHGAELGMDSDNMLLMGDSAGGQLAASLALYNRDNAAIPLKGQVLIYPMLDYRTGSEDSPYDNPYAGHVCWLARTNVFAWDKLAGDGVPAGMMDYFSPAVAKDLGDLPPAFIYVGALDLFVDEDIDYAGRLIDAGVDTTLYVVPGLYHAFESAAPDAPQSVAFWERVYQYAREALAR